jgi:hypothetical protein
MMLMSEAVGILRKAVLILESKGWTQGVSYDPKTQRFDISGAIAAAAGIPIKVIAVTEGDPITQCAPRVKPAVAIVLDELEARLGMDVAEWNDAPTRTVSQVLRALVAAADALDARSVITRSFYS